MITIRRLYQYLVCFISLQAAVGALDSLLHGLVRWVAGSAPDGLFLTFQVAVLIVAVPIFLGHWLWTRWLARREPDELNAFAYRFYLYTTQGLFVARLLWAAFTLVHVLARFVFERGTVSGAALADEGLANLLSLGLLGALWVYHHRLATHPGLAHVTATRLLFHLHSVLWLGVGTVLAALGAYFLQTGLMNWLAGDGVRPLPTGLALLAAGLPAWAYHEFTRARPRALAEPAGEALRWLAALLFGAVGVGGFLFSLSAFLHWLAGRLFSVGGFGPPTLLAAVTTTLGLWAYHEWVMRRLALPALRPLRWLYALGFSAVGVLAAVWGGFGALQWLFTGLRAGASEFAFAAAPLLPGLLVWAAHQWILRETSQAVGLASAEPGPFRAEARFVRRLYLFAFSGAGVSLATLGLIGVQEALFTRLSGQLGLRASLAWLLVGVPLWVYHWAWATRLFHGPLPDERRSDLRKAYLYLIIFAAVSTVIVTVGLTLTGLFRRLLGLPPSGRLGLSLAVILAALVLWVYHAWVLRGDIARAGQSALQGAMQRLYWYLVAALGLGAFLLGLAGVLTVLINGVAAGFQLDDGLRGRLANSLAGLLAGLPVWALAWWPAQRLAAQPGPAGQAARRSWLRRVYLYGFALVAVVVTLVSAVAVVYQLLNALFQLDGSGNPLASLAQGAGFAVIFTAVWLYHGWVLRQDGRRAAADRALDAEQAAAEVTAAAQARAARWAGVPVAVVDDGDGRFALQALTTLRRALPQVRWLPVGLTDQSTAALADAAPTPPTEPAAPDAALETLVAQPPAAEEPAPDPLAAARLLVLPWTAATHPRLAASPLPKVIVPLPQPGLHWVGVAPTPLEQPLAAAVEQALAALLPAVEPAPPQPAA